MHCPIPLYNFEKYQIWHNLNAWPTKCVLHQGTQSLPCSALYHFTILRSIRYGILKCLTNQILCATSRYSEPAMSCLIALYNFEKYQIIIDTLRASRKMCCCMLTGRNVKKNVLLCAFFFFVMYKMGLSVWNIAALSFSLQLKYVKVLDSVFLWLWPLISVWIKCGTKLSVLSMKLLCLWFCCCCFCCCCCYIICNALITTVLYNKQ